MKKGFTLIELLVVVLIIGILAAIALPMYQRAVLRSRFAALMPIVKAMNDSNEAYYLEHNSYASNPQDLPVQGQLEYPTGTNLEFGHHADYAYVLASNSDAKNNYIMYQKHSENYPGEIHCEALEGDELAEYVCVSAGGTQNIGTVLTEGYTTYLLNGAGAGIPAGADTNSGSGAPSCATAESMGLSCSLTTNASGEEEKKICTDVSGVKICRIKTMHADGGYTVLTCKANEEGECTSNLRYLAYDANGRKTAENTCDAFPASGSGCANARGLLDLYTYDANGNVATSRRCETFDSNLNCTSYYQGLYNYDYTYDENGNLTSRRVCTNVAADGSCNTYYNYTTDYTYDANGNKTSMLSCGGKDSNGNCLGYNWGEYYTYDENGNRASYRYCSTVANDGSCSGAYSYGSDYTYDANGHMLTNQKCENFDSNGNCTAQGNQYHYTYDANGNILGRTICTSVAANGSCNSYGTNNTNPAFENVYDEYGNQTNTLYCQTVSSTDGSCTSYRSNAVWAYDDEGNPVSYYTCTSINSLTGACAQPGVPNVLVDNE